MTDSTYMASTFRLEAVAFQDSARRLRESFEAEGKALKGNRTALPFYFLISHASELLLKAALFKRGFSEDDLKKYGTRHSLSVLLAELQRIGLSFSSETVELLSGLSAQHANHALRYTAFLDNGQKIYMPPPIACFDMLAELLLLTRISTQGV